MWNVFVFALIGLLAGAAARMLYPGRQPIRILGTMVLGMVGALVGGMISYIYWPAVDDQFQSGNLLVSLLGAVIVIAFSAGIAYARRLNGYKTTSP
ncbi:MAG TPA: GlsB/YeaQ/YmgE family stress response membrane protein [Gemmataceae bacterium]|nr:GlsB/YeaQ/YmgE family stress response membrane protein [Gemmataceae bacterium]